MTVQYQTEMETLLPEAMVSALTDKVRARLALNIAAELRSVWFTQAKQRLRSSLATYEAGIQQAHLDGQAAVVALVGKMPNVLEHGHPAYDMRETLLGPGVPIVERGSGRPGKHQTKAAGAASGYYRVIPFRHQTPGKGGVAGATERFARTMGGSYRQMLGDDAAEELGKAIHKAAKALKPSTSEPQALGGQKTTTRTPSGKKVRLAGMQKPHYAQRLAAGLAPKLRPHHKTDIYAGMIRQSKTYQKATHASYATFRTISTRNPVGWMAAAQPGVQIMQTLAKEVDSIAQNVLRAFVNASMGKKR